MEGRESIKESLMAPFQTTVTVRQENLEDLEEDIVDVRIVTEEENWAENTTAITGNTSERSESFDDVDQWFNDGKAFEISCNQYINSVILTIIILSAILSPLIMVILPKLGFFSNALSVLSTQQKLVYSSCNIECKGLLLGLAFKVTLLGIGHWAIFLRKSNAYMPRLFMFQSGVTIFTILSVSTHWLFYIVQMTESIKAALNGEIADYKSLVSYAGNLIDTLLFVHFVAVILIEIRHLKSSFYLKVTRTPDGISRSYAIGPLSIQRAAIWILEKYYTEFPIYNPYLERLPTSKNCKKQNSNNFKFYDVDKSLTKNTEPSIKSGNDRVISTVPTRRRDSNHNERFYEEHEYDRRVKKRRARLMTATEEAFAHIQRVNSKIEQVSHSSPLNPMEAAQSIFPSMSRSLQKYLRITRQQPRHTVEEILERLARCLAQDATPRVFLEPFLNTSPVLSNEREKRRKTQHWALVCEGKLPSREIAHGCEFQIRQGEIALLCSVQRLPYFFLTEEIALPKSNRFLLRSNSETLM